MRDDDYIDDKYLNRAAFLIERGYGRGDVQEMARMIRDQENPKPKIEQPIVKPEPPKVEVFCINDYK